MPTDPYRAIRHFWGEDLDDDLIQRIQGSPIDHLDEFLLAYPDSGMSELPALASGHIRPLVSAATPDRVEGAPPFQTVVPTLLLYAHELVLDDPLPEALVFRLEDGDPAGRLGLALRFLLDVRPLFDRGLIHFRPVSSAKIHPSGGLFVQDAWETLKLLLEGPDVALQEYATQMGERFTGSHSTLLGGELTGTNAVLRMLAEDVGMHVANERRFGGGGRVNPLFRTRGELAAYELMGGHAGPKGRRLASLADLAVPDFLSETRTLAKIREDSDSFADWREALAKALDHLQLDMLSEDETRRAETRADFVAELAPYRDRLQSDVQKSSFLRSINVGAKQFGVGAVTGAAGFLAGGSIASALASGAAGATVTTLRDYLASRAVATRESRLATLATAFLGDRDH